MFAPESPRHCPRLCQACVTWVLACYPLLPSPFHSCEEKSAVRVLISPASLPEPALCFHWSVCRLPLLCSSLWNLRGFSPSKLSWQFPLLGNIPDPLPPPTLAPEVPFCTCDHTHCRHTHVSRDPCPISFAPMLPSHTCPAPSTLPLDDLCGSPRPHASLGFLKATAPYEVYKDPPAFPDLVGPEN